MCIGNLSEAHLAKDKNYYKNTTSTMRKGFKECQGFIIN